MSTITTLEELFVEQLKDLYSAENQLIKALPAMAKAAHAPALKAGFEGHLEQTKEHAVRLEQILEELGEEAAGKKCQAMEGLIKEGKDLISEKASPEVKDVALIAAAQCVEHHEIAGYGCARTYAKILGHKEAAKTLQTTLDEEAATDKKLTVIAEKLNLLPQEEAALKN
jgi:ferritin-like metal-binding protein YciE